MPSTNSKTEQLTKNSLTSSSDAEFSGFPTGTYSAGADLVYTSGNSVMLVQKKQDDSDLKKKVKNYLKNYRNRAQVNQALNAIENVNKLLIEYDDLGLPEFGIVKAEDKSLGLSWRFPEALFGIFIQPDISESSWFLIMGDIDKGLKADGNLDDLDYEIQLSPLFANLRKLYIRSGK